MSFNPLIYMLMYLYINRISICEMFLSSLERDIGVAIIYFEVVDTFAYEERTSDSPLKSILVIIVDILMHSLKVQAASFLCNLISRTDRRASIKNRSKIEVKSRHK